MSYHKDEMKKKFKGKDLRKLRHEKGLTLSEFAPKLGYHPDHLQRLETGTEPISSKLILLLTALGMFDDKTS